MSDGFLIQGSRRAAYRNISVIRGVIAGDLPADAGLKPGDARLVVGGREFSGSVMEITDGEGVFSSDRREEIARVLDPKVPEPKPENFHNTPSLS